MRIKYWLVTGLQTLGACWFFGITIIAIAGGAVYPPINRIAKPFVCPSGDLVYNQKGYRPSPGTTIITTAWVCTDSSGGQKEIDVLPMTIPAGIIYGTMVFVVIMIFRVARAEPAAVVAQREKDEKARKAEYDRIIQEDLKLPGDSDLETSRSRSSGGSRKLAGRGEQLAEKGAAVHQASDQLRELKQMLETGLISQQEFDQKRAEILKKF